MLNENNTYKICEMKINSAADRFSGFGKILKSAWMIGLSKATIQHGKCYNIEEASVEQNSDETSDSEINKDTTSNKEDASSDETNRSVDGSNEGLIYNYSILEAYSFLQNMYESKLKSINEYSNAPDSNTAKSADNSASTTVSDGKSNSNTTNTKASDSQTNPSESDPSKENTSTNDESDETDDENDNKEDSDVADSFQLGTVLEFYVGIEDEGFTKWKIAIDARADDEAVINAIKSKKLKQAYQIASRSVKSDGLVPLSATTYINKKPSIPPAFIGHCRYGFDSGSDEGAESDLTICLAVAPINARTKKPDEKTVIKAIYNVTGDITGGALGNLLVNIKNSLDNKGNNSYGRYNDEDTDSEQSKSDELSKYLKKVFKCVGDHTMYDEFLKIRKFIKKHLDSNSLELQSVSIGSNNAELSNNLSTQVYKNQLIYF